MRHISRRSFMKGSLAAGVGLTLAGPFSRVRGANDDIRVAVVGINGRGGSHIGAFGKMDGVRLAALCDVDRKVLEKDAKALADKNKKVDTYIDIRKLLENKDIDAISIATTNHWHSLATIWACQAGKDVYVEKPCSHNVFEGRKCVEAAAKYKRIVQHGTQSRASGSWAKQVAAIASGKYGKLLVSKAWASKNGQGRWSIGFKETKEPPENLDFNIWLGPAPLQPYHENIVHYNWHWFWDFGNGEIGNQGVHQMDIARWAMPAGAAPQSVVSLGGRFGYKDQGQTPNTQLTIIDFGGPKLFFEDRGLVDGKTAKVANEFYTDEGVIKGGKFHPKGQKQGEPLNDVEFTIHPGGPFGNFIDCVRSRKRDHLNAEILEGHLSALLCHLGNVSYRLGAEVPFSRENKAFGDDKAAYEAFDSMKQHLAGAAKLTLDSATYRLGRKLDFDAKAEKFIGDDEANKLLARPYREPFVVPEQV